MKIIDEQYPLLSVPAELIQYTDPSKALFFDIETTGLNKKIASLYLIGCGYYKNNILNTRFFFADAPSEESELLKLFFNFVKDFETIIHFNGTKFDLPFLDFKAKKYNMDDPLTEMNSVDIYRLIKPLRYLLFRESMRQKCVEDFLGIEREDKYNGGELIEVYLRYVDGRSDDDFTLLMMHNREDVLGMHKIVPILNYLKFKECTLSYKNDSVNEYKDINGDIKHELMLTYALDISLPKSFSILSKNIYYRFDCETSEMYLRVPIMSGTMKHYFDNFQDYVYLKEEHRIIHKSIAGSIDKELKDKVKKENCYTEATGDFIPAFGMITAKNCGSDYKTRLEYILKPSQPEKEFAEEYGKKLLEDLLNSKPKRHAQNNINLYP